jgi:hypothetical protein
MGKLTPEELWRKHNVEHLVAFKQSGEWKRLRREGLAACGRKKRFTVDEWWASSTRRFTSSPSYMEWQEKCEAVGEKFGLAVWTVVGVCLISGYNPEKEAFPVEAQRSPISCQVSL